MNPMGEQFSVWTYMDDDPEWIAANGSADMVLVPGGPLASAYLAQQRIEKIAPEYTIDIRNEFGHVVVVRETQAPGEPQALAIVSTYPRPARRSDQGPARPARRKLGQGAQA